MTASKPWIWSALAMTAAPALAQQVDMAAAQRWSAAKVVHYQIVGTFEGWTAVSGEVAEQDRSGEVHAVDSVTLGFKWNVRQSQIEGAAQLENTATQVKATRNVMDARVAPMVKGHYEHFELTSVKAESGGRVDLKGTRTYPEALLALDYPSSMAMRPVKAEQVAITEFLAVPDPALMGVASFMPTQTTPTDTQLSFTPDQKSFVIRTDGWTWTYTPTIVE